MAIDHNLHLGSTKQTFNGYYDASTRALIVPLRAYSYILVFTNKMTSYIVANLLNASGTSTIAPYLILGIY